MSETQRSIKVLAATGILAIGANVLSGCGADARPEPAPVKKPSTFHEFTGGCAVFRVYAQDIYQPRGTAVRQKPDVLSKKLSPSFAPDEVIAVDGWVNGKPTYPKNTPPYNRAVYFHLANRDGWVSFPGVRAEPTSPGVAGQEPAPTAQDCEGVYHPQPEE